MTADLGEAVTRTLQLYDSAGAPVGADVLPTWSVTLPDGTAGTPPTVQVGSTGEYFVNYVSPQAGMHQDLWTATVATVTRRYGASFHVRPASPGPIVDLVEAKRHLRLYSVDVERDEQLRDFLDVTSELVEDFTNRTYRRTTVMEAHDGGKTGLLLRESPIQSVTTVTESGASVLSTGWVLDQNASVLYRGTTMARWPWIYGTQNVVVTYVTGVPVVPSLVRQAVKVTVAHLWKTQRGGSGLPSQGDGDGYADGGGSGASGWSLPREAEQLLAGQMSPGGFA